MTPSTLTVSLGEVASIFVYFYFCICVFVFVIYTTWYPDSDPMRSGQGGEEEDEGGGGYAREEEQHRPEIVDTKKWAKYSGYKRVGMK